jgi:hypothetical protein
MKEHSTTPRPFRIRVKEVRVRSATEAIDRGKVPTEITFRLEPPDDVGVPAEIQLGLIGEDLNRALALQKSSPVTVTVEPRWWVEHSKTWRLEVIEMALQKFPTIPGWR